MDTKLRHQVLELKVENRYAEAIELVRPWAASGVVAARAMLARMADEAGIDDDDPRLLRLGSFADLTRHF